MPYKIAEATRSDVPALTTVFLDAFKDDPVIGRVWPDVAPDVSHAYHSRQFATHFDNLERDAIVWRKVVDDSGKLVAFAQWRYPHTLTAEQRAKKEEGEKNEEASPEGTNVDLRKAFFGMVDELRRKNMDERRDYLLHLLCVSPTHQRQGLGAMLVEEGLAVADRKGAKTYIEASTKGLGLYLKYGWVPVDEIVVDMGRFGGKGVEREKCLMREPGWG